MKLPARLKVLQQELRSLNLKDKETLLNWLQTQIAQEEAEHTASAARPSTSGRQVVQEQHIGQTVYRQEGVRCGKLGCKCAAGELHGPYWYGYRREGGKLRSWYIGKILKIEG
jgi:hypothetical protein